MGIYQKNRITETMKTPDGKTVSAKSTGVDSKGLHYFTPSDRQRLEFRAKGKVKFSLKEGLGIDYALSDKKGRSDLLTKEPSDKEINEISARKKAEYAERQKQKEKEKREKSKNKTKKKLKTVAGGGKSVLGGVTGRPAGPNNPRTKLKMLNRGGFIDYRNGGIVLSTVDNRKNK
jgi:hypothetical protein